MVTAFDQAAFYVTGGTIPPSSPSYVPRAADKELLGALERGELCYVLNARQMGKSSLSVRTRQALEANGTHTAFLDLQKFGSSASAEQWYRALLERIGSDLKLRSDFLTYWRENMEAPPLLRLFGALRDVALERMDGNLVVFLDEIDVIRDLKFPTDEFFGAVRETHNARVTDGAYDRLTFCLIGTVAPTDLIQDVRMSPFNIGTRLKLSDITRQEATPLATPLPGGAKTLDRIYYWTNGHPYLTQRLCAELTREGSHDVDGMVSRLFFAKSDADVDENIKNVRNGLLRMGIDEGAGFDRTDLLTRFGAIVAGKKVPDDDTDGVCAALRLSGLVSAKDGLLHVRNRIYAHLFDIGWVRENLPDAEVRRQRAAVAKARWQIGSIAAAVLLVMAALLWQTRIYAQNAILARNDAKLAQKKAEEQGRLALDAKRQSDLDRREALWQGKQANSAKDDAVAAANKAQAATTQAKAATAKTRTALQGQARARADAEASASKASEQAARADREATTARQQAARADKEAITANASASAARHVSYISTIELTEQNIENGNYAIAQQFFNDAAKFPRSERGVEWNYLTERFQNERFVCKDHLSFVSAVAYLPDGKQLVTASSDKTAHVRDAATGKTRLILRGHTEGVSGVACSPDGKRIATGSWDGTARVWDATTGREVVTLKSHQKGVGAVAFSPDGKRLVTGGVDAPARVWDATTGKELFTAKGDAMTVKSVAYSPDGKRFVTGEIGGVARVWDAMSGKELLALRGHTNAVFGVAYSPDGKQIATASNDITARVWDAASGKELLTFKRHKNIVNGVSYSPDGKQIATASWDGTALVWDAQTGEVRRTLNGHRDTVSGVAYSPDGKRIATASWDGTARVWDSEAPEDSVVLRGHAGAVSSVAYSPDSKHLISGSFDGTACVWDVTSGREQLTLRGHTGEIYGVAYSPDGKRVGTASYDGTARVWDAASGKEQLILNSRTGRVEWITFSRDGKRIATGSWDRAAHIWDAATGKEVQTLRGHTNVVVDVAFSPDGKSLVTSSADTTSRIWDIATGKTRFILKGHANTVIGAAYSPDGRRVASSSIDGTARVWDAKTGEKLLTLKGHTSAVRTIVFSLDGKRIATGSWDGTARVWDVATGKQLVVLKGHTGEAWGVAISPDEKSLATGSHDGTVRIWRKPTQLQRLQQAEAPEKLSAPSIARLPLADVPSAAQALVKQYPGTRLQIVKMLNSIAWPLVDPTSPRVTGEVAQHALAIATLAVTLSNRKDGLIVDTLAAAYYAVGDLDAALTTQRQAAVLLPNDKNIADALKRYESLAKKQKQP